jgi:hypothetical protein
MSPNISLQKKICPFMSRPATGNPEGIGDMITQAWRLAFWGRYDIVLCEIECRKERCQAWIEACEIYREGNPALVDETMQDCPAFERDCEISRPCCAGYCALIHPVRRS